MRREEMENEMRNKEKLTPVMFIFPAALALLIGGLIYSYVGPLMPVFGHTEPNFHRIRQDDGILIYKFQDGISDCYVSANEWIHNTSQTSPAISCVKR